MGVMLRWIPETLRAAGLVVVELPGWETRSTRATGLVVKGVVCHHTATGPNTSNTAVANLLANGRSDLPGPLCQLGLDRDGHFWMIAAGRGNHNGYGTYGNDSIGIEAFNDGVGEPWPDVQVDAYQRGCAALLAHEGLSIAECRGHKETDPGRKVDPRGLDMDVFRARVAEHMEADEVTDDDIKKIAAAVTKAQQRQVDDLKAKINSVQSNLAALQRRVLGVPDMAVSADQHKADEDTGRRFQKLLGDG